MADEQYLYLTTRGRKTGLLREIEIWFTERDGRYYLIAEYDTSQWVKNIRAHREVRVRVSGKSFAAHARILVPGDAPDGTLVRAIQDLTRSKYGWGEGTVVELVPVSEENRKS